MLDVERLEDFTVDTSFRCHKEVQHTFINTASVDKTSALELEQKLVEELGDEFEGVPEREILAVLIKSRAVT